MVVFLLRYPEEMLTKLGEFLEHSPFSEVFLVALSHFDRCIENLHDKFRIIWIGWEYDFFRTVFIFLEAEVVGNFDVAGEQKIVLLIIDSVHLCDDFSHTRRATQDRRLGVDICYIDQYISEHTIHLQNQIVPQTLRIYFILQRFIFGNGLNCFSENGLEVEHDVFCSKLFRLVFFQLLLVQELEAG
jgi:hypothetical protein